MLIDKLDGSIREEIGQILAFGVVNLWIGFKIKMFSCTDDRLVKAPLAWMVFPRVSDVPLAEHRCCVSGFFQLLCNRVTIQWQLGEVIDGPEWTFSPIESIDASDGVDTCSSRMLATEDRRAGRGAVLAMVMVEKPDSLLGQSIDVRCLVIATTVASKIGVPKIICEDKDDVWRCCTQVDRTK